jgi:hypothetical protein
MLSELMYQKLYWTQSPDNLSHLDLSSNPMFRPFNGHIMDERGHYADMPRYASAKPLTRQGIPA